jgi:hypothetical protein
MYTQLHLYSLGSFSTGYYWSSTEQILWAAYFFGFDTGDSYPIAKTTNCFVRACRAFVGPVGLYDIRDIGPSGGYIFAYSGGLYYEAAPVNQSSGATWSNITTLTSGANGTAIGTGQSNTAIILAQTGHVTSAAKLCNDYTINSHANTSGSYTIDGIRMNLFGLYYSKGGGLRNLPEMKEQFFTKYGSEGYQMAKRKTRSFDFKAILMATSLSDFQTKVKNLYFIFSSAGMRDIIINNEIEIICFAIEGFTIENILLFGGELIADFRISLICTDVSLVTVDSTDVDVDSTVVTVDET